MNRLCSWCDKERVAHEYDYSCQTCSAARAKKPETAVQGSWSRSWSREKDAYSKDLLQPLKKDGTINKHFVEAHGTASLKKELKVSDKEIRANVERYG